MITLRRHVLLAERVHVCWLQFSDYERAKSAVHHLLLAPCSWISTTCQALTVRHCAGS